MNIVIVGGSLGGLFCGIALKRLGHNVRILERNKTPLLHNQGAGIVVGGDVMRFFQRYDASGRSIAVKSYKRQHLDRQGQIVHQENYEQHMTSWDLLYHLLRANFDGIDCGYIKVPAPLNGEGTATYDYGRTVRNLSEGGNEVQIELTGFDGNQEIANADYVIAADGAGSAVRKIFMPEIERTYAGYVAWRGTVPESEASKLCIGTFVDKFTFYHSKGIQILTYLIPGFNGTIDPGQRLINWVWYCNYDEESPSYSELMTDIDGKKHRVTLPVGKVQPDVWAKQKTFATEVLPPQFAALVCATTQPFVQAITDSITTRMSGLNGKLIFAGDAVAGLRPHTAASTNQAAAHAALIERMFAGEIDLKDVEDLALRNAVSLSRSGIRMGNMSQFGT